MRSLLDVPPIPEKILGELTSSHLWIVLIAFVLLALCLFIAYQYKRRMLKTK